jgi:hypothetical protein
MENGVKKYESEIKIRYGHLLKRISSEVRNRGTFCTVCIKWKIKNYLSSLSPFSPSPVFEV